MSEISNKNNEKFQSLQDAIKAEKTADKVNAQLDNIQKLLKEYSEVTTVSETLEKDDDYGPGPSILDRYDSIEDFKKSKDYEIRTNKAVSEDVDFSPYDKTSYDYRVSKWDICWCPILLGDNSKLASKCVYKGYERRPCVVIGTVDAQTFIAEVLEVTHQSTYLGFDLPCLGVIDGNSAGRPSYLKISKGKQKTFYRYKWPVWNEKKHRWYSNAELLDKSKYKKEDANEPALLDYLYSDNKIGTVSSKLWDNITKELDSFTSAILTLEKMKKNGFDSFEGK